MKWMRQQIDARRKRTDMSGNWFRVGVLSATVLTPLIARWNDLRTSNRAQTLRELAADRLSDARELATARLAPVRAAANTRIEDARDLASAKLDDARDLANAKLDDARDLASAKLDDALDRIAQIRTPEMLRNVPPFSLATKRLQDLERQRQRRRRQTTMFWLAGVGVGLAAAGVAAYVIARKRMAATIEDEEPMVELPQERNLAEATVGKASSTRNAYTSAADRQEITVPVQTYIPTAPTTNSSQARYIGNIHTLVFHDAADVEHLPTEENRIYFSSEAEATAAGYHLAHQPEGSMETENH